ncbi:MAG: hypothetical protein RJA49_1591, partial [Actinomycetota bacterium]
MRTRPSLPGAVAALLAAALVVALPLVAQLVDDSADEFSARHFAFLPALGWLVCAGMAAVVITRHLQIAVGTTVEEGSLLALAYDALPMLLLIAWPIAAVAAWTGHLLLMTAALALCSYELALVVPRAMKSATPKWVATAPTVTLVVANVFVDNETPAAAARQIVETAADVVIIVESTSDFMATFDQNGGMEAYPNRVVDPDVTSDYAIAVVTDRTLGPRSEFRSIGPLRVAIADIDVEGTNTLIV